MVLLQFCGRQLFSELSVYVAVATGVAVKENEQVDEVKWMWLLEYHQQNFVGTTGDFSTCFYVGLFLFFTVLEVQQPKILTDIHYNTFKS